MCELFSMSSRFPADVSFSLESFARHGGLTGPHKDGWGILFHDGHDTQLYREAAPASNSPTVNFIRQNAFPSRLVISHIRLATVGEITLRNTQPMQRELCGRMHVFAHNGDLIDIQQVLPLAGCRYKPIGNTDSEYAFCALLREMEGIWRNSTIPPLHKRQEIVAEFARQIRPLGPANFVYSDGEYLFIHGHKRTQPGSDKPEPPGMHWLARECDCESGGHTGGQLTIEGLILTSRAPGQQVVLAASVPLTNEKWHPFREGELLICKDGAVISV